MQCVFLPAVLSPFHQRLARCSASVFFCAAHVPSFFFFFFATTFGVSPLVDSVRQQHSRLVSLSFCTHPPCL